MHRRQTMHRRATILCDDVSGLAPATAAAVMDDLARMDRRWEQRPLHIFVNRVNRPHRASVVRFVRQRHGLPVDHLPRLTAPTNIVKTQQYIAYMAKGLAPPSIRPRLARL